MEISGGEKKQRQQKRHSTMKMQKKNSHRGMCTGVHTHTHKVKAISENGLFVCLSLHFTTGAAFECQYGRTKPNRKKN